MHKTLQGVPLTRNRQRWGARLFLLALLLTLSLTSLKLTASAQGCFEQCQQAYAQCLAAFPQDPARCDDRYDACLIGCM
jgi:hypothetical protein